MKLLGKFITGCCAWRYRDDPCYAERRRVYATLVERHGQDAVLRHVARVKAVLDRAEEEARKPVENTSSDVDMSNVMAFLDELHIGQSWDT